MFEKHAVAIDHAILVQADFLERRLDFVKFCKVFAHFAYPVDFLVFIYSSGLDNAEITGLCYLICVVARCKRMVRLRRACYVKREVAEVLYPAVKELEFHYFPFVIV